MVSAVKSKLPGKVAIGVDFGGTFIKSALVFEGGLLQRGLPLETKQYPAPEQLIEVLLEQIESLRSRTTGVRAIGVGVPGVVNIATGVVHDLSNVPGWRDVPLRDVLHTRTNLPVTVENDANAMAYAEWRFGAARGATNVVCVTLGTGVGGALILNGTLYRGSRCGAGEIGQMSIDFKGLAGMYGNCGALEKYVGNVQIEERARQLYQSRGQPSPASCTPADLAAAAIDGDPVAKELWTMIGTEIGAGLSTVVWLLNPDCIVVGGGVAEASELILEPIRTSLRARTDPLFHEQLKIVRAALGKDAGIVGSAALALES